jgi:hypothetical protein
MRLMHGIPFDFMGCDFHVEHIPHIHIVCQTYSLFYGMVFDMLRTLALTGRRMRLVVLWRILRPVNRTSI